MNRNYNKRETNLDIGKVIIAKQKQIISESPLKSFLSPQQSHNTPRYEP
jgi:hypothetical protein